MARPCYRIVVAFVAGGVGLAGCGGPSPTPEPAPTAEAAPPPAPTSAGATKPGDVVFVDDDTSTDAFLLRRRLGLRVIADEGPSAPTEPAARPSGRLLSLDRPRPGVPWVLDAVTGEVVRGE